MLSNYLKLAIRNLFKNPGFSGINLAGLALGTACCLYMLLYVRDQSGYDRHHKDGDRIYRIVSDLSGIGEDAMHTACTSPPIAPTLASDYGEVEQWTRLVDPPEASHHVLHAGNRTFYETEGYYVDSTFFKVLTYHFVAGKPEKCLDEPYTVVLTAPVAEKLFGSGDPVGQSVDIENRFGKNTFRVTGVVDGSAGKTHIGAHFFMTMNSGELGEFVRQNRSFGGQNFIYSFVKLFPNTGAAAFEAKFPEFLEKHGGDQLRQMGMKKVLHLEPLADIHTMSDRRNQLSPVVKKSFLNLLLLLAVFVQAIACINFMNLSTARATRRAKEVGIRKAIGAARGTLVGQFLGESLLLSTLAMIVATPLVWVCLPWLNRVTGADVYFSPLQDAGVWAMLAGLLAATGLVAGSYPAFYLSGFQPVQVLKGMFSSRNRQGAAGLRRGLVTVQFIIAIALSAAALVIQQQFNFLASTDLGFNQEQKISVPFRTPDARKQIANFKREIAGLPEVHSVAATLVKPGEPIVRDFGVYKEGGRQDEAELLRFGLCDEDYLPLMKIPLVSGRNFTPSDTSQQLILNEKAVAVLGFTPENAVGQRIFSTFEGNTESYEIIGVMRDFNFESLYRAIEPYGLFYAVPDYCQFTMLGVKTNDFAAFLPKIESAWQKLLPGLPFEYSFLDEDIQKQYAADRTLANIIRAFTLIALLISCLGLLGLAAFAAEQRTKEIGIRKVLGASIGSVVGLLSGDFLKLVLLALVFAVPVAWWAMNKWLSNFAYHIDIGWQVFAFAGLVAVVVAFLTVSSQAFRAAVANPVKSLRSE